MEVPIVCCSLILNGLFDIIKRHSKWTDLKKVAVLEKIIALNREFDQDADCSMLFKGTKSNKFQVDSSSAGMRFIASTLCSSS